ncbi:MAG: alpha/beta hydrolase [Aeromonas bestiarum]
MKHYPAIIFLAFLISSCSSVPDIAYRLPPKNLDKYHPEIYTIEINDKGQFHSKEQLETFRRGIDGNNIQVVAFIHGWHHNASFHDDNYNEFKKFVSQYSKTIKSKNTNKRVVGLYIGWRGDSIKSIFDPVTDVISDFWTIWGRKNTSVTVGENAVREVISDVKASMGREGNSAVIIGHSLGGSVLLNAIKNSFIQDDEMRNKLTYILLNPAISSAEYDSAVTSQLSLEKRKPLLITMQSNKDTAVNWAFRIAYLKSPVGFDGGLITHDMWACDPNDIACMKMLKKKLSMNKCAIDFNHESWFVDARDDNGRRARSCEDASRRVDWVIDARHTISSGHNSILTDAEVGALSELINGK